MQRLRAVRKAISNVDGSHITSTFIANAIIKRMVICKRGKSKILTHHASFFSIGSTVTIIRSAPNIMMAVFT